MIELKVVNSVYPPVGVYVHTGKINKHVDDIIAVVNTVIDVNIKVKHNTATIIDGDISKRRDLIPE